MEVYMKLAQLLKLRSSLRTQVHSLSQTLGDSVTVGPMYLEHLSEAEIASMTEVAENTMKELNSRMEQLASVTTRINMANAIETVVYDGKDVPLTEALAMRDTFLLHEKLLSRSVSNSGKWLVDRMTLKRTSDTAARQARQLDDIIQQANWMIEV
jgi:hypothetical protein